MRQEEGDEGREEEGEIQRESRSHIGACRPPPFSFFFSCSSRAHKLHSLVTDTTACTIGCSKKDEWRRVEQSERPSERRVHPGGKKSTGTDSLEMGE